MSVFKFVEKRNVFVEMNSASRPFNHGKDWEAARCRKQMICMNETNSGQEQIQKNASLNAKPDCKTGLTHAQVQEREQQGLTNVVTDPTNRTTGDIIRGNILTYFNLIFLVIAAILLYEGSYNNLTFLVVVILNTVIGIIQELRSKRTLDRLTLVSAPEVSVVREGRVERVPGDRLVLDDIVLFQAGNQICADGVICAGELTVNESLVTGESDEIRKKPGDPLLSGSFVISGKARARLTQVGDSSFVAQLSKDAKQIRKRQQPGMMKSLTRLIQIIGIIIIPFGLLMFWNQHMVLGLPEKISVENTAAAVIGMIPEGLYLLTSVALAASTVRLARKKTLVHDMKCIETLARVDVLCVDKTGTITEPQMQVEQILPIADETEQTVRTWLGAFAASMSADNETMKALQGFFGRDLPKKRAKTIKSFSSSTKYSAADFGSEGAYLLGAPEILLPENTEALRRQISAYSAKGARVLLFASYDYTHGSEDDIFQQGRLGDVVIPLALVVLSNAVRPQARETFAYFGAQGVQIKVISGDNPLTASIAAQEAGIPDAGNYIDATTLGDDGEVAQAALQYTVFGRVTPNQKRVIVHALQKAKHTVAMTGDGVNDVLALKDADCGIAMASGAEAAANVADLVLLNSDFSNMPHVVAEGRRVINNIERSASLFLVKNIFSFVLTLISLLTVTMYPLKPVQISLVSAMMIGVPSFFLALEPNHDLIKGKFLRNVLFRACPASLTAVILVGWTMLFVDAFQIGHEFASTMCFFLFAFSAYLMLYRVCKPMNLWHGSLFALMGIGFVGTAILLPEWFQIAPLDYKAVLLLSPLFLLTLPIDYFLHHLFERMERLRQKLVSRWMERKNG